MKKHSAKGSISFVTFVSHENTNTEFHRKSNNIY